jgi:hypothetical protein
VGRERDARSVVEPRVVAEALLQERYPDALIAFLGNAVLGSERTETADLDLVVVTEGVGAHWEGLHSHDWPVEIFIADLDGWNRYVEQEIRARRPVALRITASGVPLTQNDSTVELQRRANEMLIAGPAPASPAELAIAQRLLTDLVDDLRGGMHGLEQVLVIEAVTRQTAELVLFAQRRWLGAGKWLARLLEEVDPRPAGDLDSAARAAPTGDVDALIAAANRAIDASGGPVPDRWCDPDM